MDLIQTFRRLGQKMNGWLHQGDMLNAQLPLIKKLYAKHGFKIVLTCGACPEQYEVFKDGHQVGYLRLRHGEFRVDFPQCGGETILEVEPNGDGCFNENERLIHLTMAKRAIIGKLKSLTS